MDNEPATPADTPESPQETSTAEARPVARRRVVPLAVVAAVLVAAGVVTTVLLSGREVAGTPLAVWATDSASPLPDVGPSDEVMRKACRDHHRRETLIIDFGGTDPDAPMRLAAEELRGDPRVEAVETETRQETFERFKEIFADQPDLLDVVRPEALPASVTLLPVEGTSVDELYTALQAADIPGVEQFQLGCDQPDR
ncbi:MAG: hypothetical protein GEV28_10885 [Actinophytocola sp.]|uniref:permease-like cell division protein FtsX n=1 Tax=Actinophytocola sp. TaxID=1872138 RepID=UPI0013267B85|nr:permease-like cell division protein FtsX [Actinophytocola sp.]MPZ80865.1 hypothetical protein [Actinophytocola sp.]